MSAKMQRIVLLLIEYERRTYHILHTTETKHFCVICLLVRNEGLYEVGFPSKLMPNGVATHILTPGVFGIAEALPDVER